jgi:hypothetical protein
MEDSSTPTWPALEAAAMGCTEAPSAERQCLSVATAVAAEAPEGELAADPEALADAAASSSATGGEL